MDADAIAAAAAAATATATAATAAAATAAAASAATPQSERDATSAMFQRLALQALWRQGCGKYLFPRQSLFSAARLPAALEAAASGGIKREAQRAYIIINSLQTDM
jgi:hypothetical protein